MAKLYTLRKPGLLWWERRDVIKPGTACGCARLKWPLKSRPTEQQPQGQCAFLHARPHSPIQNVAGKNCGEQKITLALGTGPKRDGRKRINSVVSGTRERRLLMTRGKLNSVCHGAQLGYSHRKSRPGPVTHCHENAAEQAVPDRRGTQA